MLSSWSPDKLLQVCFLSKHSVVIESWMLLPHLCVGFTRRLADCKDWLWPQCRSFSVSGEYMKQNSPLQGLVSAKISLCIYYLKLIESYLNVVWNWPLGVLVLEPLLWGTLMQANVKHFLWLALCNLFGDTKHPTQRYCGNPVESWGAWNWLSCTLRPASISTKFVSRSPKGPRHAEICLNLLPPVDDLSDMR